MADLEVRPAAGQNVVVIAPTGETFPTAPSRDASNTRVSVPGSTVTTAPLPTPTGALWLSVAEIMALPNTNTAFTRIKGVAAATQPSLSFSAYSESHAKWVMANALVGVRNNDATIKQRAISGLQKAVGTSFGSDSFKELTRNLPEYIISAGWLGYDITAWLRKCFAYTFGGSDPGTIASNNETDPGNSGACGGASIAAAALYLKDETLKASAIKGIRMFCGEFPGAFDIRSDRDMWYYPPEQTAKYTPINPPGSSHSISGTPRDTSGFIPVEMERSNTTLKWPPVHTTYVRLDLGSRVIQAELLRKAGVIDAFGLGNNALLRAEQAQIRLGSEWNNPTYFQKRILELRHAVSLGSTVPKDGRCITGVDWTHPK